jgi:conjugal transfer mating pair stabilization protein TraG
MVFGSKLYADTSQIKITDPEFNSNMEEFVNQCVKYDVWINHKYTLKDIKTSHGTVNLLRPRK